MTIAPGLALHREVIRAMYEGHRGRPDIALSIYAAIEAQLAPFSSLIWAAARGHQAECLNILGRSAEALEICRSARSHLTSEDRQYVFAYQQLERETALALSGLRRFDEAVQLLDGLLAEYASSDNLLVRGVLHHDRARVACAARDREAFERHARAAEEAFAATANPALMTRGKRLFEFGRAAGLVGALPSEQRDEQYEAVLAGLVNSARASRVLDEVVQAAGAKMGRLYLVLYGKPVLGAQHSDNDNGSFASPELEGQIASLVRAAEAQRSDDAIQNAIAGAARNGVTILPLAAPGEGTERQIVGLVVLGDCEKSGALAQLDLAHLAAELQDQEEATDVAGDAASFTTQSEAYGRTKIEYPRGRTTRSEKQR